MRRTILRSLGIVALGFCAGLLPTTMAHAEPSPAEIEKQIETTWGQLEPVIEQYNNIHNQLTKNKKTSEELAKKIQPLQAQVDAAMGQVGEFAAQYYKTGGRNSTLTALLTTGSPTTLAEQLSILDQVAKSEHAKIADVQKLKEQYDGQKSQLEASIKLQAQQDADLGAKKKTIETEMDRLQKLRIQAYGTSTVGGSLRIGVCPPVYIGGKAGTAVNFACSQIGKPYVWNAAGPSSYDCSGLTMAAWAHAGVSLTHYTGAQWKEGTAVPASQARPGDLVFFYSDLRHVGLYVGNGMVVHAPSSGDRVRMAYVSNMPVAGYRRPG